MNKELDKKIIKILEETISKEHIKILEQLREPRYDEDIAEELNEKAVTIRKLLNELHDKELVQYVRTKNPKTGWYTYVWDRRNDKILEYVKNQINDKISGIDEKLDYEKNSLMFACPCSEEYVQMTRAMEINFLCQKCDGNLIEFDNSDIVRDFETDKSELETELGKINKIKIEG